MVNSPLNIPDRGDNVFVIIVAAGSGSRFGSETPKQFLPLAGKAVLLHAVDTFRQALPEACIVLVLSATGARYWSELSSRGDYSSVICAPGGDTRSHSVRNALAAVAARFNEKSVVLVHDGARPLVNAEMLANIVACMRRNGVYAAVPAMPLTEALAVRNVGGSITPTDRSAFCSVQTPQAFNAQMLKTAYDIADGETMADDAAIVAKYTDKEIIMVQGHPQNIKITNPNDIEIAEIYLRTPLPYIK